MWAGLWPDGDGGAPPIGHVTNGVHLGTWLDPVLAELLREAGVRPEAPPDEANWEAVGRPRARSALARPRAGPSPRRRGSRAAARSSSRSASRAASRRTSAPALVFTDLERLLALPVQIVVAGKAHPQDAAGKDVMQCDRRARPRPPDAGPCRLPRELRHRPRALAHPGLRRLAEQPAPPAGGLGHERHEGGRERRPQPLGARRLVGGGLRPGRRLGDRRRLGRGGRGAALPPARGARRADVHRRPRRAGSR